ncbi:hypothetical protein BSIN_4123 [Burkholderia singularis]|uniref:Uncharacterized protein n=1 Tax=Burkholderia singularis TaxID=1503053 RepID=A0A238HBK8_9BURK|nr:hypothetical protein BSIN_4123 [Burkholderia singularis]
MEYRRGARRRCARHALRGIATAAAVFLPGAACGRGWRATAQKYRRRAEAGAYSAAR